MAAGVGPAATGQGIEPLTKRKAWKALEDHYPTGLKNTPPKSLRG
jgi:hypothetical protein